MNGEFASISALQSLLPVPTDGVGLWIGDDAAAVATPPGRAWLLLAADTVVAGVHADLALTGLDDLGWKAMTASLSDIAAMGGEPGHALVTVAGPASTDLLLLYRGIADAARTFGCPVVGGDLTNATDLVVTVAVTGYCSDPPLSRAGAGPGDEIWVTGPLGAAAAGLRLLSGGRSGSGSAGGSGSVGGSGVPSERAYSEAVQAHARPVPQLEAGRAARRAGATAMIDVSDGLTADLDHIAVASAVGLLIDSIPVHPAATAEEAQSGGEDFVLAFCVPGPAAGAVKAAFAELAPPIRIGVCSADPAERLLAGAPFRPAGWQHTWASGGRGTE